MGKGGEEKSLNFFQAKRDLNDPDNALIGVFAGAITGAITTPLDVMKTRLMFQGQGNLYSGIVSCAQTILREEGPRGFLKVKYHGYKQLQ